MTSMSILPNTKNARILIIDDQPPNVLLLTKMFEANGYSFVVGMTDPVAAVEAYAESHFDIILLDINMPVLDGFGVMEKLKLLVGDDYLPIIVLTAQIDHETRLRALQGGARDFLTKPFDHMEVLSRVRNLLEVRLMYLQLKSQNETLESKVRIRTQELHDTRLEIIRRLGLAAEYRDHETGNHILRMSQYSKLIALEMGLGEEQAELILNAAPMHDIGKIGIPDRILLKPGRLNAEEWEIMRTHSVLGAELLGGHDSPLMVAAREIALSHHEKWDGSGYPFGEKGEDIPLFSRIVAVSDVFDALTSVRPYKDAWPVDEAVTEIESLSGISFDPNVVDAFMRILPQILEVRESLLECKQELIRKADERTKLVVGSAKNGE